MRIIFALVFMFGIGIAGFAAYMAMQQFRALQAENLALRAQASKVVETVPVMIATRELRYGQPLKPEDTTEVLFPKDAVPENAFTSVEELYGNEESKPRAIVRTMEPGELIMQTKVTKFGEDAGVASRLKKGLRAYTINVDVTTGVSGFLQPGDKVDVYFSGQGITRLLLEDVEIIAIDQIDDKDTNRPTVARTVTVEVKPITVATLAQARASGRLSLSLRGVDEEEVLGQLSVTQEDVLGIQTVAEEKEQICYQRVRRGAQLEVIQVPCATGE